MKMKSLLVTVAVVALVVVAAGAGYQAYVQNKVEQRLQEGVAELPEDITVEYGEVEVGLFGKPVRVNDVAVSVEGKPPTVIEQVVVLKYDRDHETPHHMHVRAVGVAQDLTEMSEQQANVLRRLGYKTLRGTYEMAYDYDAAAKTLSLKQLRGDVDGMAGIGLELELTEFDLEQATSEKNPFPTFKVAEFAITYRDASLMRRLIREGAKEQGISEEEFVAQLLLDIEAQAGKDELFKAAGDEIKAFLKDPQKLTIAGRPPEAVAVTELMATAMIRPQNLPQLVNLQVKAN